MDYYEDIEDLFEDIELEEEGSGWEFSYSDLLDGVEYLDLVNNNEHS